MRYAYMGKVQLKYLGVVSLVTLLLLVCGSYVIGESVPSKAAKEVLGLQWGVWSKALI